MLYDVSMNWNAPPPADEEEGGPEYCEWVSSLCCPLCPEMADQPLAELDVDAIDASDGKRLELSILACSWHFLTHWEIISSLLSS